MKFGDKKTLLIAGGVAAVAIVALLAVFLLGHGQRRGPDSAGGHPDRSRRETGPGSYPATLTSAPGAPGAPTPGAAPTSTPGTAPKGAPARPPGLRRPGAAAGRRAPADVAFRAWWASIRVGSGEYTAVTRPDPDGVSPTSAGTHSAGATGSHSDRELAAGRPRVREARKKRPWPPPLPTAAWRA